MSDKRIVVVGTTTDYIDMIATRFPGRSVFVTDPRERASAIEPVPDRDSEVLCDLSNFELVASSLRLHLLRWQIQPSGVACFDCESMALAAYLADGYGLPYPRAGAIAAVRDKYRSKALWLEAGVPTPKAAVGRDLSDAISFLREVNGPIVIKPTSGSGSELVFVCSDLADLTHAVGTMARRLSHHLNQRMYPSEMAHQFTMEEFIAGPEFSCDFIVDGDRTEIIRVARKIPALDQPVGTALAYVVPGQLPGGLDEIRLSKQLHTAAQALGIDRAICMVDFIVRRDEAVLIEMTPRPGGDCLPPLIRLAGSVDMLGMALDFAEGRRVTVPPRSKWRQLVGVRMIARESGVIRQIDTRALMADPRVVEIYLKRRPGHHVILPPDDYDSRILGHAIFVPSGRQEIEHEARELAELVQVEMETPRWVTPQAYL